LSRAPSAEVPQTLFDVHVGPVPAINRAGEVAFVSVVLTGGDTDVAIVSWDLSGLRVIAREGDGAPGLAAGVNNVGGLGGGEDGRDSVINDRGQVAFGAHFTDGSSGIFISNAVAVPEPWIARPKSCRVIGVR
jgi:hypothetical protein